MCEGVKVWRCATMKEELPPSDVHHSWSWCGCVSGDWNTCGPHRPLLKSALNISCFCYWLHHQLAPIKTENASISTMFSSQEPSPWRCNKGAVIASFADCELMQSFLPLVLSGTINKQELKKLNWSEPKFRAEAPGPDEHFHCTQHPGSLFSGT